MKNTANPKSTYVQKRQAATPRRYVFTDSLLGVFCFGGVQMLTEKELKRQLVYDAKTGIFIWKVTLTGFVKKGDIAGHLNKQGYIRIGINNQRYLGHRLAWFYVYGYFPENQIDHKDQVKHHNWISNLREVNQQCNTRNSGNWTSNTSGVKGVSFEKKGGYWTSYISLNEKSYNLYRGHCFAEAVAHRLAAEQCLDWANCESSSPAFKYMKHKP